MGPSRAHAKWGLPSKPQNCDVLQAGSGVVKKGSQAAPKWQSAASAKKFETAYLFDTLRVLDFFASLHLTIFERPMNYSTAR
jgi:hypothetical protein